MLTRDYNGTHVHRGSPIPQRRVPYNSRVPKPFFYVTPLANEVHRSGSRQRRILGLIMYPTLPTIYEVDETDDDVTLQASEGEDSSEVGSTETIVAINMPEETPPHYYINHLYENVHFEGQAAAIAGAGQVQPVIMTRPLEPLRKIRTPAYSTPQVGNRPELQRRAVRYRRDPVETFLIFLLISLLLLLVFSVIAITYNVIYYGDIMHK